MTDEVIIDAPKRDFYLKLTSEAEMPAVLSAFYRQDYVTNVDDEGVETQVADGDPYMVTHTHDYAIDVVGVIHEWHVNIRLVGDAMRETVEALDATHGVTPNSPSRVWL
jgi:hypothetical protein